ncbi:MAG: nitroreductase family deazaflavin-dependent oxidoreductase [Chloroflexi bacterium]|nr:MAG: nitroreductase family deazaflavin-dependent oxidoreductase [Chloroflexota bacterium]
MATRLPLLVSVFNPVARRLLRGGIPLGPNTLLTVRGRKSGQPRTTGVALVEAEGRRWVVGTFGEVQWTQNLRAAGEGTLTRGRHQEPVEAVELDPEEAPAFFKEVLGPYVRRIPFGLGKWMLGSILGAPDILEDPVAAARRHPVFELHPRRVAA